MPIMLFIIYNIKIPLNLTGSPLQLGIFKKIIILNPSSYF